MRFLSAEGRARELTYGRLAEETSRFANLLRSLGVGKGERIFALLGRIPEIYVAALGTLAPKEIDFLQPVADVEGTAGRPLRSIRQAIAAAMARSKREIPHYYLAAEIDFSRALAWMAADNARLPVTDRLLPIALLLDIDSIDFLRFVVQLHERLGVDVPEVDYPRIRTLDGCVSYLYGKRAAR